MHRSRLAVSNVRSIQNKVQPGTRILASEGLPLLSEKVCQAAYLIAGAMEASAMAQPADRCAHMTGVQRQLAARCADLSPSAADCRPQAAEISVETGAQYSA